MVNPRRDTGVFLFRMNINYNYLYLITKVLYICINNKTIRHGKNKINTSKKNVDKVKEWF